jgi:hypothetical protein
MIDKCRDNQADTQINRRVTKDLYANTKEGKVYPERTAHTLYLSSHQIDMS